jgi:hypothetical protein
MHLVAVALVVPVVRLLFIARARPGGTGTAWARILRRTAGDIRHDLLAHRAWLGIALISTLAVGGRAAAFLIEARTADATAQASRLVAVVLIAMAAMMLPAVGSWGPRERAVAWVFGGAGPGAQRGVATAVVDGITIIVASLPGVAVLVGAWFPRSRPTRLTRSGRGRSAHA